MRAIWPSAPRPTESRSSAKGGRAQYRSRCSNLLADFICASVVICGFFGLAFLFGERITGLIQTAERGFTAVVVTVVLAALAVVAFFSFRQRRIRMLDQDPESLFDNREILLGPAADRIADAVALGDSRNGDRTGASPDRHSTEED